MTTEKALNSPHKFLMNSFKIFDGFLTWLSTQKSFKIFMANLLFLTKKKRSADSIFVGFCYAYNQKMTSFTNEMY